MNETLPDVDSDGLRDLTPELPLPETIEAWSDGQGGCFGKGPGGHFEKKYIPNNTIHE